MRILFIVGTILFASQNVFLQGVAYKFGEFDTNGPGCLERSRIVNFMQEIIKNDSSKGLIVVYAGDKKKRFGNLLGYISGVGSYFDERNFPKDRISFRIGEGKRYFNEEFWIIPEDAEPPQIEQATFDWAALNSKYHFSTACLSCDPSYPELSWDQAAYQDFAEILKHNQDLSGLITVNNRKESAYVRYVLQRQFKLPASRFAIKILKSREESHSVDLYLEPVRKTF